jgi:hypothetical protein
MEGYKYIHMAIWTEHGCVASGIVQYKHSTKTFAIHNDFTNLIWRISNAQTVEEFVKFVSVITSCCCEEDVDYWYDDNNPLNEIFVDEPEPHVEIVQEYVTSPLLIIPLLAVLETTLRQTSRA